MTFEQDALRYQWLKSRWGLTLHTDGSSWTDADGVKFTSSHRLCEGGTQHPPGKSLDDIIDAAMLEARK